MCCTWPCLTCFYDRLKVHTTQAHTFCTYFQSLLRWSRASLRPHLVRNVTGPPTKWAIVLWPCFYQLANSGNREAIECDHLCWSSVYVWQILELVGLGFQGLDDGVKMVQVLFEEVAESSEVGRTHAKMVLFWASGWPCFNHNSLTLFIDWKMLRGITLKGSWIASNLHEVLESIVADTWKDMEKIDYQLQQLQSVFLKSEFPCFFVFFCISDYNWWQFLYLCPHPGSACWPVIKLVPIA